MGCRSWVQSLAEVLLVSLLGCVHNRVVYDRDISRACSSYSHDPWVTRPVISAYPCTRMTAKSGMPSWIKSNRLPPICPTWPPLETTKMHSKHAAFKVFIDVGWRIYASVNKAIIGWHKWLVACPVPSRELNECRLSVNWTMRTNFRVWLEIKQFSYKNIIWKCLSSGSHFVSALMGQIDQLTMVAECCCLFI